MNVTSKLICGNKSFSNNLIINASNKMERVINKIPLEYNSRLSKK